MSCLKKILGPKKFWVWKRFLVWKTSVGEKKVWVGRKKINLAARARSKGKSPLFIAFLSSLELVLPESIKKWVKNPKNRGKPWMISPIWAWTLIPAPKQSFYTCVWFSSNSTAWKENIILPLPSGIFIKNESNLCQKSHFARHKNMCCGFCQN